MMTASKANPAATTEAASAPNGISKLTSAASRTPRPPRLTGSIEAIFASGQAKNQAPGARRNPHADPSQAFMSTRHAWRAIPSPMARSTRCGRRTTAWIAQRTRTSRRRTLYGSRRAGRSTAQSQSQSDSDPCDQEQAAEKLTARFVQEAGHPQDARQDDRQQPGHVEQAIHQTAHEQTRPGSGLPDRHAHPDHVAANQRDQERVGKQAGIVTARGTAPRQSGPGGVDHDLPLERPQHMQEQVEANGREQELRAQPADRGGQLAGRDEGNQGRQDDHRPADPQGELRPPPP